MGQGRTAAVDKPHAGGGFDAADAGNGHATLAGGQRDRTGVAGWRGEQQLVVITAGEAAFALHVAPEFGTGMIATRAGTLLASADVFEVTVRGRGGHASMPHLCRDPIPAACAIVPALQTFLTRSLAPNDPAVITVTMLRAGTTNNVIPETATLIGTIRAHSEAAREKAHEGVHRVADGLARAHGVEAEVKLEPGYPVTVNDVGFEGFVQGVARELLGPRGVVELPAPFMGAEDFSYVLQKGTGSMAVIACGWVRMSTISISMSSPGRAPLTSTGPVSGCTAPVSIVAMLAVVAVGRS